MLDDLIETIQAFAYQTDQRFDQLDNRVMNVESQVMHVENRVINIERTMPQLVTKSYLDDKLAEMRGDFVSTTRQEDQKVTSLVDILRQRKLITSADVKRLMVMTPFPKSK